MSKEVLEEYMHLVLNITNHLNEIFYDKQGRETLALETNTRNRVLMALKVMEQTPTKASIKYFNDIIYPSIISDHANILHLIGIQDRANRKVEAAKLQQEYCKKEKEQK